MWPSNSELKQLSRLLSLPLRGDEDDSELQDWDWDFADSGRVADFLDLYDHAPLSIHQKTALMSLIVESYDERLASGNHDEMLWGRIESHLIQEAETHEYTIERWRLAAEQDDGPSKFDIGRRILQLFGPSPSEHAQPA